MAKNKATATINHEDCTRIALEIIELLHKNRCDHYDADSVVEHLQSLLKMQAIQSSDTFEL